MNKKLTKLNTLFTTNVINIKTLLGTFEIYIEQMIGSRLNVKNAVKEDTFQMSFQLVELEIDTRK